MTPTEQEALRLAALPRAERAPAIALALIAWEASAEGAAIDSATKALREENGRLLARLDFLNGISEDEKSGWCGEHPRRFAVNAGSDDEGPYDSCQVCRAEKAESANRALVEALKEAENILHQ